MDVVPIDFFNELLECYTLFVSEFFFGLELVDGVTLGGILVAIAVFGLFIRIFVVRLKNG